MTRALVVGGTSGIGLGIAAQLVKRGADKIYLVGRSPINSEILPANLKEAFEKKTELIRADLTLDDLSFLDGIEEINELYITAGFGRIAPFDEITDKEIENGIKCNVIAAIRILKRYYRAVCADGDFYCGVLGSVAGHVASPLFALYGAEKSALRSFIESVNCELSAKGRKNRITEIAPGNIGGTCFYGGKTNLSEIEDISREIVENTHARKELFIPNFEIYGEVLKKYENNPKAFGMESYKYKENSGRISKKPQVTVGYLSGTFDLFHIGHLNLIRRAREKCDYLIVGVHDSGAWKGKETYIPFEERLEIVQSLKYVDLAVKSFDEDSDAYEVYKYDKLFVGSDYKGSERFNRYEEYFKDKGVEIVYFPYTKSTSSTQLRTKLSD